MEEKEKKQILCGGGLITKTKNQKNYVLLIIHRKWGYCIPKWRKEGEDSYEQAAQREIEEETGIMMPEVVSYLWEVCRETKKKHKCIHVFHMKRSENRRHYVSDRAFEWVEIEHALKKMRHDEERKFLENCKFDLFPE